MRAAPCGMTRVRGATIGGAGPRLGGMVTGRATPPGRTTLPRVIGADRRRPTFQRTVAQWPGLAASWVREYVRPQ